MKNLFIFGLVAIAFACNTPESKETTKTVDTTFEDAILKKALVRNDVATALVSINRILEMDSSRYGLYDTLFQFYYEMQNPSGLADVGQILLQKTPNDLAVLEATAAGLISLQEYPAALELENRMFAVSGDLRLKLQIATLLFEMKQIDAARAEIQYVLDHREIADTMKVEQPMPSYENRTQKVNMTAIAYFSLGQLEMELGNKKAAISNLNKALNADPRFDMAATAILQLDK